MKNHDFKPIVSDGESTTSYCDSCSAFQMDDDVPFHFKSGKSVSWDCNEAKSQIENYELQCN